MMVYICNYMCFTCSNGQQDYSNSEHSRNLYVFFNFMIFFYKFMIIYIYIYVYNLSYYQNFYITADTFLHDSLILLCKTS